MPQQGPEGEQNSPKQGPSGLRSALNKLKLPLRVGKGVQLAAHVAKAKIYLWIAAGVLALFALGLLFLIVVGMSQGLPSQAGCTGGSLSSGADTLAPGGGILVGASEYGGPGDPGTSGDKGAFISHLTGHMAYAELGLSSSQGASKIGDALGLGKALAPHTKLQITANGHSVIAEKLDVGAGGGPVGSPPHERVIDLWYQTAAELGLDNANSGQWSGLVRIQLVNGASASAITPSVASNTEPTGNSQAPPQPQIVSNPIPFGQKRKDEMRAYAIRHYGIDSYELQKPKVIVEHFTETHTWQEAYNTFAPDTPDPELHELPGTTSHFIIDQNGVIHQVLPLNLMARHTVGLNYTAIGIEMVGMSDQDILNDPAQLNAALTLTRWLQSKYGISTSNVIGHNESLSSPFHHENVARLRNQTHSDWNKTDMDIFRSKLAYEPSSGPAAVSVSPSAVGCETEPEETGDTGSRIVAIAQGQIGVYDGGNYCSPYSQGRCEFWCSDFLTWVWEHAGVKIPISPGSQEVYTWGQAHSQVLPPTATPAPGDAVEFGTGPESTTTSTHVAIVEKVYPDGEITIINGDYNHHVERSGPFQPSQALNGSGAQKPIYGYVVP
jgi:beta-N-acetylhexosaminidase